MFWLGITCYILATRGQMLSGAARVQAQDPQIPSLMPWHYCVTIYTEKHGWNNAVIKQHFSTIKKTRMNG